MKKYRYGQTIDGKYVITWGGERYFVLSDSWSHTTVRGKDGGIYTICREDIEFVEE